jgi:nicotinamide-nucleotide amidase
LSRSMTTTTPNDEYLTSLGAEVGQHLLASGRRLVTAESCTGGWIGKVLTDIAGSSTWFLGGVVVYSNSLKQRLLGVESEVLAKNGAVSEATACAMVDGALANLAGEVGVAVTGIAGPDGGTPEKPVGTVWFAWRRSKDGLWETVSESRVFSGTREQVRRQAVAHALTRILEL